MSINRAKVNALVDDDGSGTVGTLYKKQNVVDIYDDVDLLVPNRVNIPWAAGNFSGNGSMVVTVEVTDLLVHAYQVVNKLMTMWFEFAGASITGTPNSQIRIALPAGFTVAGRAWNLIRVVNNATASVGAITSDPGIPAALFASCDVIGVTPWNASANNTGVAGQLTFPVN